MNFHPIIFTCEHATPALPANFKKTIPVEVLKGHRVYDVGTPKLIGRLMRNRPSVTAHFSRLSRLAVDHNRSINSPHLFSKYAKKFPAKARDAWLQEFYLPYRASVAASVKQALKTKKLFFVFSVHSFTPVYRGKKRKTDIGILFRPWIDKEKNLAYYFRDELKKLAPEFRVHMNLPYRGHTDCFLNDLADENLKNKNFQSLFLEFNQNLLTDPERFKHAARAVNHVLDLLQESR